MNIISQQAIIVDPIDGQDIIKKIELCGRVCYKSEGRIGDGTAETFVRGIVKRGHEAVLEHFNISVRFITDRGVSHEIVRHRVASYCQESTRYCNYTKEQFGREITVIEPLFEKDTPLYNTWKRSMEEIERAYFELIDGGATAQEARAVLPNSLKTELIMTANLREWRHFFKLRCAPAAHPQIRVLSRDLLRQMQEKIPVVFDDLHFDAE